MGRMEVWEIEEIEGFADQKSPGARRFAPMRQLASLAAEGGGNGGLGNGMMGEDD